MRIITLRFFYSYAILIFFSLFSCLCLASEIEEAVEKLPSYSAILDAQLRCDDSALKKIAWDRRYRDVWRLAYKTWSILSDIKLTEEKRDQKKELGVHRDFRLKYVPHARIICGESAELASEVKEVVTLPVVVTAFKRQGFFDIYNNDEPIQERSFLHYMQYTDMPNPKGMDGLSCLVKLEDFIKDPLKSIDLKKICKGESKKKIEFTEKEILRVASILKQRMDKKNSDKK